MGLRRSSVATIAVGARRRPGAFARLYRDDAGGAYPSALALAVARLLRVAGVEFTYREGHIPKFESASAVLLVPEASTTPSRQDLRELRARYAPRTVAVVSTSDEAADETTLKAPVVRLDGPVGGPTSQAIFVDDASFAFDYAHILPTTRKCSVLHGHTSAVLIEIVGQPIDGMIVDFGEVKRLVREALQTLDHKLFIARRYMTDERNGQYRIRFESPHGPFDLSVPQATTYLLEGQATVENLAREVVRLVLPRTPPNVEAVGAYVYEGLNKGSHLLAAALHRGRS